jgi:hypothetical protein
MEERTAAIVIDNFLSESKWQYIQNNIDEYLHSQFFVEDRNDPYPQVIEWIKEKLQSIDVWNDHWKNTIDSWSFINTLPAGVDRESSGGNGGYHSEFGGFVYYIHPSWESDWGGHLKFKDCNISQIDPTPNRFVWINPAVWHGIEVVNLNAKHNRITVVGWPEGCVEYEDCSIKINTLYQG